MGRPPIDDGRLAAAADAFEGLKADTQDGGTEGQTAQGQGGRAHGETDIQNFHQFSNERCHFEGDTPFFRILKRRIVPRGPPMSSYFLGRVATMLETRQ